MDNSDKSPRNVSLRHITPVSNQDVESPGTNHQEDARPGTNQLQDEAPGTSSQLENSETEKAKENNPKPRKRKQKKKHTSLPDSDQKSNNEEQPVLEGGQQEAKKRKKKKEKSSDDPPDCCQQWCLRNVEPQVQETLHREYREELNNGPTQGREYLRQYISHTEPKKQGQRRNYTYHYQIPLIDDGFMYICLRAFLQIFQITQTALREARRQLAKQPSQNSPSSNSAARAVPKPDLKLSSKEQSAINAQLYDTCRAGNVTEVKNCLKQGAEINSYDINDLVKQTVLHHASGSGHDQVCQVLLQAGADVHATNEWKQTALHLASRLGHDQVCQVLLQAGPDVHASDWFKKTALHLASELGHDKVCQVLLQAGADVHATNEMPKQTALHFASVSGHDQVCQVLLQAGADVHARDRVLLQAGAVVHATDVWKQTALHCASRSGHDKVCQVLLQAGADVHATDEHGLKPIDILGNRKYLPRDRMTRVRQALQSAMEKTSAIINEKK